MPVSLAIDRTTIKKGPCLLITSNLTFYSAGDVTLTPQKTTWDVPTSIYGKQTDRRLKDVTFKVGLQQAGDVTAALLAAVYATGMLSTGQSIFGASDPSLTIISLNDTVDNCVKMRCAGVTKLPDANFKTDATLFGGIEFTCIGANATPVTDPNRFAYISSKKLTAAITGTSNANPDVITSNAHGLAAGDPVSISGVTGDTAVNGNWYVINPTTNTFEISSTPGGAAVAGTGAYVSGGTWRLGWPFAIQNVITSPFSGSWATTIPTGSITSTDEGTPDTVTTAAAHGLIVGDRVEISGDTGDTAINGTWWVVTVGSDTTFQVSATRGGAAIAGAGDAGTGGTFTRVNPLDLFDTEEGIQVTFNLSLTPKRTNSLGTYDILFSSLTVSAKGLPVSPNGGPDVADILNALNVQGSSVQIGQSMAAEGRNLNLVGNGIYFRLYQASVDAAPTIYSAEKLRAEDFQWTATRSYNGNSANPLFAISTSPLS